MGHRAFKRSLGTIPSATTAAGFGRGLKRCPGNLEGGLSDELSPPSVENGYELRHGRLTIRLPKPFGFCWGCGAGRGHGLTKTLDVTSPPNGSWIHHEDSSTPLG